MQDQITELAARLTTAATEDETRSVDLAIYHLREDRKRQRDLMVNLLLAQVATVKALFDADDDKLQKLANEADMKLNEFEEKEEAA